MGINMGVMVNVSLVFFCTECFLVLGVIVIYESRVLPKCAIISDITTATTADSSSFLFLSKSNLMAASSRTVSRSSSRQEIKLTKHSTTQPSKPADYVYFDRTTTGFSDDAAPRAKAAQLKLEHYYKVAVDAAIERNTRFSPPACLASVATDNCIQDASSLRDGCRPTQ
jgi:hypothetical protein